MITLKEQPKRRTVVSLKSMSDKGAKAAMLSIYDYAFAQLAQESGVDIIIVGDSVGMTQLGYKNTLPVTVNEMLSHAAAVKRGAQSVFIVGDMPFMSYQSSNEQAIINAGRFIKESGCEAVKCETSKKLIPRIKAICDAEIIVMGHIGLNPQKIHEMGGYRIQGKTKESAKELLETALQLQDAGVFSILLEGVTEEVAEFIKENLKIPIYGIGSGRKLDGQLLIAHDILDLYFGFKKLPTYIKRYYPKTGANKTVGDMIMEVFSKYVNDVKNGKFPSRDQSHNLPLREWRDIKKYLNNGNF